MCHYEVKLDCFDKSNADRILSILHFSHPPPPRGQIIGLNSKCTASCVNILFGNADGTDI